MWNSLVKTRKQNRNCFFLFKTLKFKVLFKYEKSNDQRKPDLASTFPQWPIADHGVAGRWRGLVHHPVLAGGIGTECLAILWGFGLGGLVDAPGIQGRTSTLVGNFGGTAQCGCGGVATFFIGADYACGFDFFVAGLCASA